jgi:hypothetical protein
MCAMIARLATPRIDLRLWSFLFSKTTWKNFNNGSQPRALGVNCSLWGRRDDNMDVPLQGYMDERYSSGDYEVYYTGVSGIMLKASHSITHVNPGVIWGIPVKLE